MQVRCTDGEMWLHVVRELAVYPLLPRMQESSDGLGSMLDGMIGVVAAGLSISGIGFQLYKMAKTKETRAISYNMSAFLGGSIMCWVIYGISINDRIIYVTNGILVVLLFGMFAYKWKSEHGEEFIQEKISH